MDTGKLKTRRPLNRRLDFWVIILITVVLIGIVIHRHDKDKSSSRRTPVSVVAATVRNSDVPVYISALGNVTPTYTITVKTQINGQLLRVLFKEGQFVKAGDIMAEIDPRPYQAQLIQYEGQLQRDTALLANARLDLTRYQTLWKQDSVSKQVLDTQASLVNQYIGTVKLDEGLIATTKLNLFYCLIRSPVNGRVGLRLVDPGNFVQTSDTTGLFVIDTLDPITVIFTIPEDNIPDVMNQLYAGKVLTVQAYDRQQTTLLSTGTVLTMDNQIDPTTGTVKIKALFPNSNNHLFPSQFVNMQLLVKTLHNVMIVPTAAVQYGAKNPYVFVLNPNKTVNIKPITIGVTYGNNTVISGAVTPGQQVIIEGVDKLIDGSKVELAPVAQNSHRKEHPSV